MTPTKFIINIVFVKLFYSFLSGIFNRLMDDFLIDHGLEPISALDKAANETQTVIVFCVYFLIQAINDLKK